MNRAHVLNIPVDALTAQEARQRLFEFLDLGEHKVRPYARKILSVNPEIVLRARRDPAFAALLASADLLLPDGTGVVWALRRQGEKTERVTGVDAMVELLRHMNDYGGRVFMVLRPDGLTSENQVRAFLQKKFPKVVWDSHTPDAVFVALGAPEQERWIQEHIRSFPETKIFMAVGGGVDLLVGSLARSPQVFRQLGIEWLWRLFLQPGRLPRIFRAVIVFPLAVIARSERQ